MAKKTKAIRVARPARASVGGGVDFLRVRLDQLCDQAATSLVALRAMDLGAKEVNFREAFLGLEDACYYLQGVEEAITARQKAMGAAEAMRRLAIDDYGDGDWDSDGDGTAFGLTTKMLAEVQRGIKAASVLVRRTA